MKVRSLTSTGNCSTPFPDAKQVIKGSARLEGNEGGEKVSKCLERYPRTHFHRCNET